MEEFSFEGAGGIRIVGNYIAPKGEVEEVVLFHHGIFVDLFFPPFQRALLESLAAPGRLVLGYDSRGHGRSCFDFRTGEFRESFDVSEMVADISLALAWASGKFGLAGRKVKFILIGHSLGGYVCLRASAGDDRISKVITISSPVSMEINHHKGVERLLEELLVQLPEYLAARLNLPSPIALYRLKARDLKAAQKSFLSGEPISEHAGTLTCPVTFIIGEQDVVIELFDTREETAKLAKKLPGSKIILVPGEHAFLGVEQQLAKTVISEVDGK